jgi:glycosyltransferase involved in cell wall biosynthesis
MRADSPSQFNLDAAQPAVDVSIVMPCLNEAQCLPICIANAHEALAEILSRYGLFGEIIIADNGSTDGSQQIAESLGARVVPVDRRGYGAALIGGAEGAFGRFILMGDADGSYDFRDGVQMIGRLAAGAELCMGSRFKGGIAPGAMPWKNRYIGNPVLTGILNLLFRSGIEDAHCGLRAIRKDAFLSLRLTGSGMEFASEMVIKAALRKLRIEEVPATLSVDLRDREPHLRPWRDGWRHLRYLFMLSPTWVFGLPALAAIACGLIILAGAALGQLGVVAPFFGSSWTILAGALIGLGHMGGLMAVATHLYGVMAGYRRPHSWTRKLRNTLTLETMLLSGLACGAGGLALLGWLTLRWSAAGYTEFSSLVPVVAGVTLIVAGVQNMLGGFMLSVICGNEASFMAKAIEEEGQLYRRGSSTWTTAHLSA